jgi:hypothetical protein
MTRSANEFQQALTRAAINGARQLGVADSRIQEIGGVSAARLDAPDVQFADSQLKSLARIAKRSLGELFILGDPTARRVAARDTGVRRGLAVLAGLRESQEMIQGNADARPTRRKAVGRRA